MRYYSVLAEMIRGAREVHGALEEVVFLQEHQDCLLVFADGTVLPTCYQGKKDERYAVLEKELCSAAYFRRAVEQMSGRDPFSVIAFGYSGTGPQHFEAMLSAAGFRSYDVTEIDPPLRLRRDGTRVRGARRGQSIAWEDGSDTPAVHGQRRGADGPALPDLKGSTEARPKRATPRKLIRFRCNECGKGIGATRDLAGKQVKCPTCGRSVVVPKDRVGRAEAERHIAKAAAIADQGIEFGDNEELLAVYWHGTTMRSIQLELEAAVRADPANPEYQYLLACAKMEGGLGKTGFEEIRALATKYPHFAEALGHAAHPDQWRTPFKYPPWNSQQMQLPTAIVPADRRGLVTSVRDGCRRVVGFFCRLPRHALGADLKASSQAAVRAVFMDTPCGPVVGVYALVETDPAEPFTQENILNVASYHPEQGDLSYSGYWLVRLLAQQQYTYIVLAEPAGGVYFNRKVAFDAQIRSALNDISGKLARIRPVPLADNHKFQMAQDYFTQRFSMDRIRF